MKCFSSSSICRHASAIALAGLALGCRPAEEEDTVDPNEAIEARMEARGSGVAGQTEEQRLDELYGARSQLAPRPEPTKECDDKQQCTMAEPDPPLAAAHGAREFMKPFRWGMPPGAVLDQLATEVEAEAAKNASSDAMKQDQQRKDLEAELEELKTHLVDLSSEDADHWKVTVLKNLYSPEETMVWFGSPDMRRYYFFNGDKLWHMGYAYNKRLYPKKTYVQIIDEVFKPMFGYNPEVKERRDDRSGTLDVLYTEWASSDGERIRAYDLFEGHGLVFVSVLRGEVEDQLGGQRFPENELDPALRGGESVDDIMKSEGICYDDNGDMVHDPEFCKKQKEKKSK